MSDSLAEYRMMAAMRSGGTSSSSIKHKVLEVVAAHGLSGRVLDFGAGTGELAGLLAGAEGVEVYAADIMLRPDGFSGVEWFEGDLNEQLDWRPGFFDAVICSEVIEHLENPRLTFRTMNRLLKPGGRLLLTMPNQENIRSYLNLMFRGHFAAFQGAEYPAHITALLRLDLSRICSEAGFSEPSFFYVDYGWMPITRTTWQRFSFNLLRGRLFSDTVGIIANKER